MQGKINNKFSLVCLLFEIFPILFLWGVTPANDIMITMQRIGLCALICFQLSLYALKKICGELNAFIYFTIFVYLFSFGQCITSLVGAELKSAAFAISRSFFSVTALTNSSVFVLLSIQMTCIGFSIIYKRKNLNNHVEVIHRNNGQEKYENKIITVGWILLIIGGIPTFINLYNDYKTILTVGYGATLARATGGARILTIIAGFFISGLLLLYCFENNKKRRIVLFFVIVLYWLFQIIGGSRIQIFRTAVIFILLEDLYFKRMNRKRWVITGCVLLLSAVILSLVSSVRNYLYLSDDPYKLIMSSLEKMMKDNFIYSAINEMGNTQVVNTIVFDNCPKNIPFQYGFSFVKILWGIIPNFIGDAYTGYIGVDITFSPLYTVTSAGIGASYISEGYWNFGILSFLYFIIFGALWGRLINAFNDACCDKTLSPVKFFIVLYIIYYALFLVRGETIGFGRSFVYYAVLPCLLISKKNYNRKNV